MSYRSEVTEVLLRILGKGVLRIRTLGWAGLADQCAIEADHLHNLPPLIIKPNLQEVIYYFNASRVDFIRRVPDANDFESDWARLAALIQEMSRLPNSDLL
jgi:hypothetical protein